MIETAKSEATKNILNLVLTNAHRISKRAGIGWAFLDELCTLISHTYAIAGANPNQLSRAVQEHGDRLNHLIISVEPSGAYFDLGMLINCIEQSNCLKITIGCQLPQELRDKNWLKWAKSWGGELQYAGYSNIAVNLSAGIRSILGAKRPWVSAISASTIENQAFPLSNLKHEFGFSAYLGNLVKQNTAVLFNRTQGKIIEQLPAINWAGQAIEFYDVEEPAHAHAILEECAGKQFYSVVLICDPNKLSRYAELNMVDEIYHHIAIANSKDRNIDTAEFLKLENWTIMSSDVVGNCIRMSMKRNDNIPQLDAYLRNRLN